LARSQYANPRTSERKVTGTPRPGAAGHRPRWRLWPVAPASALSIGLLVVVVLLVGMPIVILVANAFRDKPLYEPAGHWSLTWWTVLDQAGSVTVIRNSVIFVAVSILVAAILALPAAWLIERTDLRGTRIWRSLIIASMALSPAMTAFVWVVLAHSPGGILQTTVQTATGSSAISAINIQSLGGMGFVGGVAFTPTVYTMIAPNIRMVSGSLEEASYAAGAGVLRTLRMITMPLVRPATTAALLIMAITMLGTLEIPIIVGSGKGLSVFATRMYQALNQAYGLPNENVAAVFGVVLMAMAVILMAWYYRAHSRSERYVTVTGRDFRPRRMPLRRWSGLCYAYLSLVVLIVLVLPLLTLVYASVSPFITSPVSPGALSHLNVSAYRQVPSLPGLGGMLLNTLYVGIAASTCVLVIGLLVAWLGARRGGILNFVLSSATFAPIGIPTVLVATAMFLTYLYVPVPIEGTISILIIAYTTSYMAFAFLFMRSAVGQVSVELEQASTVSGAHMPRTFARITLPLVGPAAAATWMWIFAHVIRDMTIAPVLESSQNIVVGSFLWEDIQNGSFATFSVIAIGMTLVLFALVLGWQATGGGRWQE
jgi:iron(III) transport system permease protein